MKCEKPSCYNDAPALHPHPLFGGVCFECYQEYEKQQKEAQAKAQVALKKLRGKYGKPARRRVKR